MREECQTVILLWIAVRLHSDSQKDTPVFGQAEGLVGVVVVTAFLFGVATAMHQAIHGAGYWLFTHERPRFVLSGRYLSVSAPGWYLGRLSYAIMLLAPLLVWLPMTFAAIAFVPATTIYWLAVTLALNIAICTSDLPMLVWLLRQPRRTLFSDHDGDTGTTAWTPTI